MLKLEYISDIHIKTLKFKWKDYFADESDFLVLLGDIIDIDRMDILEKLFSTLKEKAHYKKIFMVAGNHEYYSLTENRNYYEIKKDIKNLALKYKIIFLDNTSYKYKNYLFIGSTLWSDVHEEYLFRDMPVYDKDKVLTRLKFNELNDKALEYIFKTVQKNLSSDIIIFTHYPPVSDEIIRKKFENSKYRFMYGNSLHKDYFDGVKMWFYGHVHRNLEFKKHGVKFKNNQYCDFIDKLFIYGKYVELE